MTDPPPSGRNLDQSPLRSAGAVATLVGLALLWVISSFDASIPFAPTALAERVIRLAPGDLATFFIELLQHWALRLLSIGVLAATFLFGMQMLVWSARRGRARPFLSGFALALLAALAAFLEPGSDMNILGILIASALAGLAYGVTAARTLRRSGLVDQEPDLARRRALRNGLAGAAGIALGGGTIAWLGKRLSGPDTDVALAAPGEPAMIPERPSFPDIPGLTPEITPIDDHYVVDINLIQPSVEADTWSLKVIGQVNTPIELTFEQLQERFEVVEEYAVLSCISNEVGGDLVGHSLWGGVRLADVLNAAGVEPGAADVVFRAADGYADSITLETAMDPAVLLAVSQNREPLRREHGFPCRVRVPAIFGMKNVKWLESIEVVNSDYLGYWQKRGWSDPAPVRTQSRIDVPLDGTSVDAGGDTWIAGIAWAGDRGISKVEVSTDGGKSWTDALLKEPIGPYSWTQWAHRWVPTPGDPAVIVCRATDGNGDTQTDALADPHPNGATGWHTISVPVT